MRKIYVTNQDRANERSAMERFVAWMNKHHGGPFTGELAGPMMPYDWLLRHGPNLVALCEYKRRTGWHTRHDFWHIAEKKIEALKAAAFDCQALIIMEWDDGLFVVNVAKLGSTHIKIGGRYDRGDAADVESMVNIPRQSFIRII